MKGICYRWETTIALTNQIKKLHSDYQHNKRYLTTIRISCFLPTLTSYIKLYKKK